MNILPSLRRSPVLKSLCCLTSRRLLIRQGSSYEHDGKTYVSILNDDQGIGLMIDSYSQCGFRLNNGIAILGPIAIFPQSVLSWNVEDVGGINEDSLSLLSILEPKLDIIVLGIGDTAATANLNKEIINYIRKFKINVETLPTDKACSTFNFLNAESRCVAALLIPPDTIRPTEDDIVEANVKRRKVLEKDVDFA